MSKHTKKYLNHLISMLERIDETQEDKIEATAKKMAETIINGGSLFVFGPGHAGMLTQELYHRAGSFILTNPILHSGTLVSNRPITTTSAMEKLPGFGEIVLNSVPIKEGDMLIIHSVAARIPIVTEMAVEARKRGIFVASIVNMEFASNVTSLDPSGNMLYDVSDIVIDDCGDFGDASILIEGMKQKVAATSTITACMIGHMIEIRACEYMLEQNFVPPVVHSTNVDGGDAENIRLFKEYKDRIFYL
ncbi:MAG TPA: SIS domain-containing protein [Clostridiales bacterium]|nr:SIS domain-containing protein [Clostridiales bacterium]